MTKAYVEIAAGLFILYFLLAWLTVYFFKPRTPRNYFLLYLLVFGFVYVAWTGCLLEPRDDFELTGWFACLTAYVMACLTFWNSFYSILWGFSSGVLADFCSGHVRCDYEALMLAYERSSPTDSSGMNRMLYRRIPGLMQGGYLSQEERLYRLSPKGVLLARITRLLYRFFALGKGGGIIEEPK